MNALFYDLGVGCSLIVMPGYISDPNDVYINLLESVEFENKNGTRQMAHFDESNMLNTMKIICESFKLIKFCQTNQPNVCVVNYYRNGSDYLGWNANISNPTYIVSIGRDSNLQLNKKNTDVISNIVLPNGSLAVMYGDNFRNCYRYKMPKSLDQVGRFEMVFTQED